MSVVSHPTACVESGANIGSGTRIWRWTHVMSGAKVGSDCVLGQNVFVADGVNIGDGCRIQNNVSVYRGVNLENNVFCGPSVVFTNVRYPRAHIRRNTPDDFAPTLLRMGATIGANATIVCGVTIGRFAFVGAGAVVTRDVPDYALMTGVPARQTGWACQCGLPLDSDAPALCTDCGAQYTLVDETLRPASP